MNVQELFSLKDWYEKYVTIAFPEMEKLAAALEHNSSQPNKREITPLLEEAMEVISEVPMYLLDIQQISFLDMNNIRDIVGLEGSLWLEAQVRTANFDPALAARSVRGALTSLHSVSESLKTAVDAMKKMGFEYDDAEVGVEEEIIVRLRFDGKSGIRNVSELKKQSSDWYEIVRAISGSVDEAPEHTKIIGATNGSIILILSATAAVATVLAVISKKLTSVISDGISLANAMEDLKHKKIINRAIEKAMLEQQKDILSKGVSEAVSSVKSLSVASNMSSEVEAALTSAVKKIAAFQDNGGEIDMIAPPDHSSEEEEEDGDEQSEKAKYLYIARKNIIDMQRAREEMRELRMSQSALGHSEDTHFE